MFGKTAIALAVALSLRCASPLAAEPLACLIQPNEVVELGTPVVGVLEKVAVERGDIVSKGQVVAQLVANVERAAVSTAEARARAQADLQAAQSSQDFARKKLERTDSLHKRNFISRAVLDQASTEFEVAESKTRQANEQRQVSVQELGLARAQLAQRTIRSPLSGVVVERYVSAGERVDDKPIVRLAMVDPLKVEVIVPATNYNQVFPGMMGMVMPELPEAGEHKAKVVLVDRIIDAASNTFRVRLELPNPDGALPAGLRCKVDLGLAAGAKIVPASYRPDPISPAPNGFPATARLPAYEPSPSRAPLLPPNVPGRAAGQAGY
jgi:RND family efflux transporter MFP subunit